MRIEAGPPSLQMAMPRQRVWLNAAFADALRDEAGLTGATAIFMMTTRSLSGDSAPARQACKTLGDRIAGWFGAVSQHTPLEDVLAAASQAREVNADLIVAIGGGSVIDAAKAVRAAFSANLRSVDDYERHTMGRTDAAALPGGGPPIIAVPTTLSAAEYSCRAGYLNPRSGLKEGVRALDLAPMSVVLDPKLAILTPFKLWVSSGIRALDHAVEGIFSPKAWPGLQAQAASGLALLAQGLRASHDDGTDVNARSLAQQGVLVLSEVMEQVPMGASHGLGYLLGALGGVPHGLTSCVLLPGVVAWNTPVCPGAARIVARSLGAADAAEAISSLIADLGLPIRIRDLGVELAALDDISEKALANPVVAANPRPFRDPTEVRAFLASLW